VPGATRGEFHRELDRLDISVAGLLGLIPDAVVSATTALLVSDESIAAGLTRWRALVEELYADVEHTIEVVVARQSPVAGDLRFLLACVRLVPGLYEVVDLVAEVASPSHREIGEHLNGRVISLTERLGQLTSALWATVEEVWRGRSPVVARRVREQIDGISETRSTLVAELASGTVAVPVAMEMAVVCRTYGRLAHHAGSVARHVDPLIAKAPSDGLA
jgi:phosphate transport system protein